MKYMDPITPNPNRIDLHEAYMQMAEIWAKRSKCNRKHVGVLIVKGGMIISDGYNGMPADIDEDIGEKWIEGLETTGNETLEELLEMMTTKPEVSHAESNALLKLTKFGGFGTAGADMYVTLSPCTECAKLIKQAGIKNVFYRETYRDTEGLERLKDFKVNAVKLEKK